MWMCVFNFRKHPQHDRTHLKKNMKIVEKHNVDVAYSNSRSPRYKIHSRPLSDQDKQNSFPIKTKTKQKLENGMKGLSLSASCSRSIYFIWSSRVRGFSFRFLSLPLSIQWKLDIHILIILKISRYSNRILIIKIIL